MSKSIKRAVQSGKTIAVLSSSISQHHFVFIEKLGTAEDWKTLRRYRNVLAFVDDAQDGTTVSARALHKALGSKQKFTDWIKKRLEQNQTVEGTDFSVHKSMTAKRHKGEHTQQIEQTDFLLTPELSKSIAMMEGTAAGFTVRKYFILCEKIAKSFVVYNSIRAEAFTKLDNRLKHQLAATKQGTSFTNEVHREVCKAITGWSPYEWEVNTGERPRDALSMIHKRVYLAGYEFLVALVEGKMKWAKALPMLQGSTFYKINASEYRLSN